MARLKKDLHKYVEIREEDYLQLVENTMIVEAMKLAGVEKLPLCTYSGAYPFTFRQLIRV